MAIEYYADNIVSNTYKLNSNIDKIILNAKNIIKSNKFLKFLLHDFLDFNMYKN